MRIRTDLAVESLELAGETLPPGVVHQNEEREGVNIDVVNIRDREGAEVIGKPEGTYITLTMTPFKNLHNNFEGEVDAVAEKLSSLLPAAGLALVVGLGNSDITPDALGPFTARQILATRHISAEIPGLEGLGSLRPVAAIAPGVMGQTGIETAEVIRSIAEKITPSAIIAIDALASKNVDRLGCTIQISDSGIVPGGGVQNKRKELNRSTLGTPVISMGVPTVVDMSTIAYDLTDGGADPEIIAKGENFMVTPREIDSIVQQAAKIVAASVNKALQPSLTMEEIIGLSI